MEDAFRYYVLAYAAARRKRPIMHEHGATTVTSDGAEALGRAEALAKEYPDGWVYIHVEYRGIRNRRWPGGVDLLDPRRLIRRDFLSIARRLTKRGQGGLPGFVAHHGHQGEEYHAQPDEANHPDAHRPLLPRRRATRSHPAVATE